MRIRLVAAWLKYYGPFILLGVVIVAVSVVSWMRLMHGLGAK